MSKKHTSHSIANRAFTLVEILIVIGIIFVLTPVLFRLLGDVFIANTTFTGMLSAQDSARHALTKMTAELRTTAPSSLGSYPIAAAGTSSITFYADIDDDGLHDRVRYFVDGTLLQKGVIVPSGTPLAYDTDDEVVSQLVDGIVNDGATDLFSYYDASYAGTTSKLAQPVTIADIRSIKTELHIDDDITRPPGAFVLTTQVTMRNLKDN